MATRTTNFGLYKPDPTDDFGDFRSEFNANMDEIDSHLGGGGGGGGTGGNVYGTFIDTNNVIQASTMYQADLTYVATEDCVVFCEIVAASNNSAYIAIDGKNVEYLYSDGGKQSRKPSVFLRKGQTLTAHSSVSDWNAYYTVYGLIQGTESIFTPIIYSDNERMIGIWRDNKPLYQRSFPLTVSLSGGQTATIATLSGVENIIHASGWLNENNIVYFLNDYSARIKISASGELQLTSATGSSWNGSGYITLQYTKTADVAGSGDWNTDGVPTVHYSSSEQVIGTWIDSKPLYEKTYVQHSTDASGNYINFDVSDLQIDTCVSIKGTCDRIVPNVGTLIYEFNSYENSTYNTYLAYSKFNEAVQYCVRFNYGGGESTSFQYITIQYTKTTD